MISSKRNKGRTSTIGFLLLMFICMFAMLACDYDESVVGRNMAIVIKGKVILSPVDGAEIRLFHYGDEGSELEIIAANAPVITSSSGEYEFQVNPEDVKDLDTPLVLRSSGGTMGGQPAPELEALLANPAELAFAEGIITRHLSAASSMAAQMLRNQVAATDSAPMTKDAEACIAKVENALEIDLTQDPSDASQAVAIENMNICQDLDLFNTPENNGAVRDYIKYVAVNLNSSSHLANAGEDDVTNLSNIGNGSLAKLFDLDKPPLFYRLKLVILRESILGNKCDSARIFISLRNGWGKVIKKARRVAKLEIVYGDGLLSNTHPKLKEGRARVSITSGTPGKIVILAKYKLKDGKKINGAAVINVVDEWNNGNKAPVADAGEDQTVTTGSMVILDGSNSSDPENETLDYDWTILDAPQGSSAVLSDPTVMDPSFTADKEGSYAIRLVVSDGSAKSNPDTVTVTTDGDGDASDNSAPSADAGPDQQVAVGTTVALDGRNSSDPDDDALTYAWTIKDAPQGSSATLSDPTVATPTFVADMDGTYVIKLVVNDGSGNSNPATVTITAVGNGNSAPTADAGADQQVSTGTTVMLNGSDSSDPDGDSLTYAWTIVDTPQGSDAALSNPTTTETVFFTPDVEGTYKVQLVVNDGSVSSNPDKVKITATSSGPSGPDGEALYLDLCKSCHGADGTMNGDLTDMTADELMSLLPHYNVTSDDIGGTEGAEAIADYIAN